MSLRVGDPAEIGGYVLEARLGAGGMGTVFLARTGSGRPVAIKLIHQQFAADEEFRTRFRQEVAAARRVSGAFTAAVVDAAPDAEQPWMATSYIEGETLSEHIAAKGPLEGPGLRRLAIGLAEALRDIHRAGVVHRDLKPSNVVLSAEGPRVIDFGISRAADQQTLTMTGRIIGTPPFMSPEQLQAPRGVGPGSDVFSLGTLLVYAVSGRGPFDADSPYMTAYQVVHEEPALDEVPPPLRAIVESCLDKDPARRPSADELLVLLRDLPADLGKAGGDAAGTGRTRDVTTRHDEALPDAADSAATPAPVGRPAPDGRRARRRWRTALAAAAAVAVVGGGVAVLTTAGSGSPGASQEDGSHGERAAALPAGFTPWRVTVTGGRPGIPDELRCAGHGEAVYCGGGGVVATRVDVKDGSRRWTVRSEGVPVSGKYFVGATEDTALGYRFPPENAAQGTSPEVVALDAGTGEELWSVPTGGQGAAVTGGAADAVVSGSVVVTVDAAGSRLEAREAHDGRVLWRTPFPAGAQCSPVLDGRRLLAMCASQREIDALDVRTPELRTLDKASGKLGGPLALAGRYVPVGAAGGRLVLLREHTEGTAMTGYDAVALADPAGHAVTYTRLRLYAGNVRVADGTVYVTGQTGRVTAIDPADGRVKWSRQTAVEGASGPVAGRNALYFSSASGRVVALGRSDGKILWNTGPRVDGVTGEGDGSARVAVAGDALVVAAAGNTLFAFDARKPPKAG